MRAAVLFALLALVLGGCRQHVPDPRWAGAAELDEPGGAPLDPGVMSLFEQTEHDPPAEYASLIAEAESRGSSMFDTPATPEVMDQFEQVFLQSGRVLELADYLLEAGQRQGPDGYVWPYLAMLYERLGMSARASEVARAAAEARPDDPHAHFAVAFVLGQDPTMAIDHLVEIQDALNRVIELDPEYVGRQGVNARQIREEITQLDSLIGILRAREAGGDGSE